MKKIEFEKKLIELVEAYTKAKISLMALQTMDISVGVIIQPQIRLNGIMVEKE